MSLETELALTDFTIMEACSVMLRFEFNKKGKWWQVILVT